MNPANPARKLPAVHPCFRSHRFCIAPMMDWTDRHERHFLRQFSPHMLLYTEMITSAALLHGDRDRLLEFDAFEQPLAIQLGGSEPDELARAAKYAEAVGYGEINLNIGCPSDRVIAGRFGACLMAEPNLVARCVQSIGESVQLPVTVKCRIGINGRDSESELQEFVDTVARAGCHTFIVHARIAVLEGLSPKENREIPPLDYDRVYRLKSQFPDLEIIVNGGIRTLEDAIRHLDNVDGVMIGREAYQNPFTLNDVDSIIFNLAGSGKSRMDYLLGYLPYIEHELSRGTPLHHMTRHVTGLFKGIYGGKNFRRHLSENATRKNASLQVLTDAMAFVAESSSDH